MAGGFDQRQRRVPAARRDRFGAFWGSRFATVDDPDGNHIGIMSAEEPTRRTAPPDR